MGKDWNFEEVYYCFDIKYLNQAKRKNIIVFCALDCFAVLCLAGFGNLPGDMVCSPD
jgi:hypothetical protein